jgi:hypothetical protein
MVGMEMEKMGPCGRNNARRSFSVIYVTNLFECSE